MPDKMSEVLRRARSKIRAILPSLQVSDVILDSLTLAVLESAGVHENIREELLLTSAAEFLNGELPKSEFNNRTRRIQRWPKRRRFAPR